MTEYEGTGRPDESDVEGPGWREGAPNPTQERMDREGAEERPGDVAWDEDAWGEREPEGTEPGP